MMPFEMPVFPVTLYHPVLGARTANASDNMKDAFPGDPTDWFKSAGEADAARTDREAQIVIHHRVENRLAHAKGEDHEVSPNVVENSVQADERIRAGKLEP